MNALGHKKSSSVPLFIFLAILFTKSGTSFKETV